MAVCAEQAPPESKISTGHLSACWLHAAGLTGGQSRPLAGRHSPVAPDQGKEA
jgi:hypothetical protein